MTRRTTQGIVATLGTFTILVGAASQVSASENDQTQTKQSDPAATPAAYANYLRHSQEEGAPDALKAFQNLTQSQQNKFIDYLHDPDVLKSVFDKATDEDNGISADTRNGHSTTSLYNGDITIGQERTISGLSATASALPSGDHTVDYTTYVKYFGVKVIKLNLSMNFHSNGRDITKVNKAEASKRNLSGVISLSHEKEKKWLNKWTFCQHFDDCSEGHHANASVIWTGEVGFRGSVFQVDKKQWMKANANGKLIDYYLHNV